jgi:hypothetical protein
MRMTRRDFLPAVAAAPALSRAAPLVLQLGTVQADVLAYCEAVRDKGGPYGCYRGGPAARPDLYASCDVAQMRAIVARILIPCRKRSAESG